MDFAVPANHTIKIKVSDRQILERIEKTVEHEGNNNTNSSWYPWKCTQRPGKEFRETRDQRKNWDRPDYIIVKIR